MRDVDDRGGWVVRSRLCSVAMTIYVASEAFKVPWRRLWRFNFLRRSGSFCSLDSLFQCGHGLAARGFTSSSIWTSLTGSWIYDTFGTWERKRLHQGEPAYLHLFALA